MKRQLVEQVRNRVAQTAVGPSALRNQGGRYVVQRAREFLRRIDLSRINVNTEAEFRRRLDKLTEALRSSLPQGARNWGTARKALNLFLRDAAYSFYLREHYDLARLEPWLEVPLDSLTAAGISRSHKGSAVPPWPGVKHLTPQVSDAYQEAASQIGESAGTYRVHLDLSWWRA
jgi:hypothetical protein